MPRMLAIFIASALILARSLPAEPSGTKLQLPSVMLQALHEPVHALLQQ